MKDKREAVRRAMRYTAWLTLDGDELHGCALSDISDTGARIDVEDSDRLPDHFMLLLSGNGVARRKCRIVWRQPRQIGVTFERRLPVELRANLVPAMDADTESEPA
ncbi:MAG TPA: PilZ domain-containing protein [Pseudolabrys sp.]|nr:PilZ domain-containing protein [Pseudolabrys sp.]